MGGEQIHRQPERTKQEEVVEEEMPKTTEAIETSVDLKDIDALLDEIDSVLEVDAVEFVANYQQKGGQ